MSDKVWADVFGDFGVAGDWTPMGVPGSTDIAILNGTSYYMVTLGTIDSIETQSVGGVTIDDSEATLEIGAGSTLAVAGTLDLAAGYLRLDGLLAGGTLEAAASNTEFTVQTGATLSDVTIGGAVSELTGGTTDVIGGLQFASSATGPGELSLVGFGNEDIEFLDSETLTGGEIALTDGYYQEEPDGLIASAGNIETFGTSFTLAIDSYSTLAGSFVNEGTILVAGYTELAVNSSSFTNLGTVELEGGATLGVSSLTTAQLVTLTTGIDDVPAYQDGVISLNGTLDNSDAVLTLGTGALAGELSLAYGTVLNGTISVAGASGLHSFSAGTLSDVTFQGPLDLAYGSGVTITNGITLESTSGSGPGTLVMTGYGKFFFADSETFDNALLAASGYSDTVSGDATLTLGGSLTVTVAPNAELLFNAPTLVNDAAITVSAGGLVSFASTSAAFVDTGIITLEAGSTLEIGGTLDTGQLLALAADVTGPGAILFDGTLINDTPLDVASGTSLDNLVLDADVIGGTIVNTGTLTLLGGTLDGVTLVGSASYGGASYQSVTLRDGFTSLDSAGAPGGTLTMPGYSDSLVVQDGTALGPLTLVMSQNNEQLTSDTPTLTLGAGFVLQASGVGDAAIATTLVNAGTLDAVGVGAVFRLVTTTLVNSGTVAVASGAALSIGTDQYGNPLAYETLSLTDTGTFDFASGSALTVGADQTTGQLLTILGASTGVAVTVLGTLDNAGAVLAVTATGPESVALDADVIGGTVVNGSGVTAGTVTVTGGELQNVTFDGPLQLYSAGYLAVTIAQGLTLDTAAGGAGGTLDLTGGYAYVTILDGETLDAATVNLAGSNDTIADSAGSLTLGAGLAVDVTGAATISSTTLVNDGAITVARGGALTLAFATFTNAGTITVAADAMLSIAGPLSGAVTGDLTLLAGSTLALQGTYTTAQLLAVVDSQPGVTLELYGTLLNSGTVTLGSGLLDSVDLSADIVGGTVVAGPSLVVNGATLSGVTTEGTVTLAEAYANLTIGGGLTLDTAAGQPGGTLALTAANATVSFQDNTPLGAGTILLAGYSDTLREVNNGATLSFAAGLTLDDTGIGLLQTATFINAGTVLVAGAGAVLDIETGAIASTGIVSVGSGDVLGIDASIYGGPINGTLALSPSFTTEIAAGGTLELGGTATAAQLLSLLGSSTDVVVDELSTLLAAGQTVTVNAAGAIGTLLLGGGSEVIGGTLLNSGGSLAATTGTLDGVAVAGELDLTNQYGGLLTVIGGLTLTGASGSGPATLVSTGLYGGGIGFADNETLADALIEADSTAFTIEALNSTAGTASTFTLAASTTLVAAGNAVLAAPTLDNAGTVLVTDTDGLLSLVGSTIINSGSLSVAAGGTLAIDAQNFFDANTAYGFGTQLDLIDTGAISIGAGGTLVLGSTETTAQLTSLLQEITGTGIELVITGTLINSNATLTIGNGELSGLVLDGLVEGGTIVDSVGPIAVAGGTLDAVTVVGALGFAKNSTYLGVIGGLTVENAAGGDGTIAVTGTSDTINISDGAALNDVLITVAAATGYQYYTYNYINYYYEYNLTIQSGVGSLGLGAGVTIASGGGVLLSAAAVASAALLSVDDGGTLTIAADTIINTGTIMVGAGSALELDPTGPVSSGAVLDIANSGVIELAAGSTLVVGGIQSTGALLPVLENISQAGVEIVLTGSLENIGATLDLAPGALGEVLLDDTVIGGTVIDGGGTMGIDDVAFQSVTFVGALRLGADSLLTISDGFAAIGVAGAPGSISLSGYASTIAFTDSETLDNLLLSVVADAGTLTDGQTLTLGAHATVDVTGFLIDEGSVLVNDGTIAVTGSADGSGAEFEITAGTFVNNGLVTVGAGDVLALDLASSASSGLALFGTGSIELAAGSTLEVGGALTQAELTTLLGSISSPGVTVVLDGTLLNTGETFASVAGTDLNDVVLSGVVLGGTVTTGTGTLSVNGATFNGVTYRGTLSLTGYEALSVENGLTLEGQNGTGPATLLAAGGYSVLDFLDASATLANVIVPGSTDSDIEFEFSSLTLAPSVSLNTVSYAEFFGGSLVNDTTIGVTGTAGYLYVETTSFTNDGIINVGSGDSLFIDGIENEFGYYYSVPITYSGYGTVNFAAGSVLYLDGNETTAQDLALIGSIVGTQTGVTVELGGYLANTGTTLDFTPGGSLGTTILDANITGGTIVNDGGSLTVDGGTFNQVAYQGVLTLDGYLTAIDFDLTSLGGALPGTIEVAGDNYAELYLETDVPGTNTLVNSQTLANLVIAGTGDLEIYTPAGETLTLAASLTSELAGLASFVAATVVNAGTLIATPGQGSGIRYTEAQSAPGALVGGGVAIDASDFVNLGAIVVEAGATLQIASPGSLTFDNAGSLTLDSGATFILGGSLTPAMLGAMIGSLVTTPGVTVGFGGAGTLALGGTFVIPATGSLSNFLFNNAVLTDGTVDAAGTVGFAGYTSFDDVNYVGTILSTAPGTYLELDGASRIASGTAGPETINLLGSASGIEFSPAETANNTPIPFAEQIDNTDINLGAATPTGYGDEFDVYGGTLTLGATTTLDAQAGLYVEIANEYGVGATLVNDGTFAALGGSVQIESYSYDSDYDGDAAQLQSGDTAQSNLAAAFVNNGLLVAGPGSTPITAGGVALEVSGSFVNTGTIEVSGADMFAVDSSAFANTGTVTLSTGATLDFAALPALAGTIALTDGAETLRVDSAGSLAATLLNFGAGDLIDLTAIPDATAGTLAVTTTLAGSLLEVFQGSTEVAAITLPGLAAGSGFSTASDTPGTGTAIALTPAPCFHAGTRIRATSGEVAVEHLAVGTSVPTASGGTRTVMWIGHRHVDCTRHPRPEQVLPIRVRAGAFADGLPRRDLVLSPDHSLFVDGVLIPVRYLLNGATIVRERVTAAHYFHVELSAHDVLFAEGLPAESYLDTGNRAAFANGGAHLDLHPDFTPRSWAEACAPLCQSGPVVARARARLRGRAIALGYRRTRPNAPVLIAGARRIAAVSAVNGLYRFLLPANTAQLRIVSDSGVPDGGDCRHLGIAIGGIVAHGRAINLTSASLGRGFYDVEGWGGRWTDGEAELRLPAGADAGVLELRVVEICAGWEMKEEKAFFFEKKNQKTF